MFLQDLPFGRFLLSQRAYGYLSLEVALAEGRVVHILAVDTDFGLILDNLPLSCRKVCLHRFIIIWGIKFCQDCLIEVDGHGHWMPKLDFLFEFFF